MHLRIRETDSIDFTEERETWFDDPEVAQYIYFKESVPENDDGFTLTNLKRFYEVYERDRLVGDIKLFYDNEEDILNKRVQILMVVGDRNRGIGTQALHILLDKIKNNYQSVYCHVLKSNIASLKILKHNGFQVENMDGDSLLLTKQLY